MFLYIFFVSSCIYFYKAPGILRKMYGKPCAGVLLISSAHKRSFSVQWYECCIGSEQQEEYRNRQIKQWSRLWDELGDCLCRRTRPRQPWKQQKR